MTGSAPPVPTLPEGQEETLRALARAMFRGSAGVALGTAIAAVTVAGVLAGAPGALSALVGAVLAIGSSLFTLWLMRRSAALAPHVVMATSLGGFLMKMIVLLPVLFLVGRIDGVHRSSLAMSFLALIIVIAHAEALAGYRLRTLTVEPAAPVTTATGSSTDMSDPTTGASHEMSGRPAARPSGHGHEE